MQENVNTIGKDFSLGQLIAFVAGPVFTNLMVSVLQTLDDSLFISRYCGENALAAFSVAMPMFMLFEAVGMVAGSVSVGCSIKMGQKKNDEANSDFTTMAIVTFAIGCCITLIMFFFRENLLRMLGETDLLMPYAMTYMNVSMYFIPLMLTSFIFSRFYVIAGKPKYAVISTVLQTFMNLFFDWLFIVKMNIGIVGAAYANMLNHIAVFIFALVIYANQKQEIHFVKPTSNLKTLLKDTFHYGKTQCVTSISISINTFLANTVQLYLGGELFVAAFTIVNNVQWMFMNSFFSLLGTASPIVSYAYGEKNVKKLVKTIKQITVLVTMLMLLIIGVFIGGKNLIIMLYLTDKSNPAIKDIILYGMKIVPFGFMFFGYNVLVQNLMTAVSNTKVSMILSFIQHIVLQNILMLLIPFIFGINGVWYVFAATQVATLGFSIYAVNKYKDVYGYGPSGKATFAEE